ncbi:MAG: hypothetical protein ACE5DO_15605 [Desulfobacterales bacterium]
MAKTETSQKLTNMLKIISGHLFEHDITYSLIGAFALNLYGLPKYTADIDLLTEGRFWASIKLIMEKLGYRCFQRTTFFAQFDSELGVYGKIDFMFVNTDEGKNILERSALINDDLFGRQPVIQPTDYIILKLMAIANDSGRFPKDEADILDVLKLYQEGLIPDGFERLDNKKVLLFAERFGQRDRAEALFGQMGGKPKNRKKFKL